MNRRAVTQFRRPGKDRPTVLTPWLARFWGRAFLLGVGTAALAGAFAGGYPLAYLAVLPWLLLVHGSQSDRAAFLLSWTAGTLFFLAVGWWICRVNLYGGAALVLFLGLYWAAAGLIVRRLGLLTLPPGKQSSTGRWLTLLGVPTIWVGCEWVRGTWPWHGLPVVLLAYTQSPAVAVCQIADITGAAGVSFAVALLNVLCVMWVTNRLSLRGLVGPAAVTVGLWFAVVEYGVLRLRFEPGNFVPGPTVMVVQSDFHQKPDGDKGVALDQLIHFHLETTRLALGRGDPPALVLWSETVMPPLNDEAVENYKGTPEKTRRQLEWVAYGNRLSLITGGVSWSDIHAYEPRVKTNCTYLFPPTGRPFPRRYDKIDLVPFGEFIPFETSVPPLYKLAVSLSPPKTEGAMMQPGDPHDLTVFPVPYGEQTVGVVTPICFEDSDADLCARMFRPDAGSPDRKRAGLLANVSNDGWFGGGENDQHLQSAVFRSIENRVPSVRSVNTGVSGFIDPMGRVGATVPAGRAGTATATVPLDARVTLFTRTGDLFGKSCAALTGLCALIAVLRPRRPGPGLAHRAVPA